MSSSAAKFKIESGVQLLARLTKKPDVEFFFPTIIPSGLKNGDVIEVFGDSCVPNFLIYLISEALTQCTKSGAASGVLIFNTDGNINYEDLIDIIKKKLSIQNCATNNLAADKALKNVVANLHVVNIYDVTQFYTTIHNLENILVEYPNISLLVFNTLTAFYWSEQGCKITRMDLYIKNVINTIQKVTKEYKSLCLFTRPEYFCTNRDSNVLSGDISYQIQLLDNGKDNYQVNVKSTSYTSTKFYKIEDKKLQWF